MDTDEKAPKEWVPQREPGLSLSNFRVLIESVFIRVHPWVLKSVSFAFLRVDSWFSCLDTDKH